MEGGIEMNAYVVDSKRKTWNKNGKFWFESVEQTIAYAESWEDIKEKLK